MKYATKIFISILIGFAIAFVYIEAHAIDWVPSKQFTCAWDANPAPDEGSLVYELLLGDQEKNILRSLWKGPELKTTVTIDETGRFLFGIKAIHVVDGQEVAESPTGWSDDPEITANKPWGVVRYDPPPMPTNFRPGE